MHTSPPPRTHTAFLTPADLSAVRQKAVVLFVVLCGIMLIAQTAIGEKKPVFNAAVETHTISADVDVPGALELLVKFLAKFGHFQTGKGTCPGVESLFAPQPNGNYYVGEDVINRTNIVNECENAAMDTVVFPETDFGLKVPTGDFATMSGFAAESYAHQGYSKPCMVLSGWVWWAKSNGKGQLEYMYETFPEKYYMKTLNDCLKSDSALIRRLERAESEQEINALQWLERKRKEMSEQKYAEDFAVITAVESKDRVVLSGYGGIGVTDPVTRQPCSVIFPQTCTVSIRRFPISYGGKQPVRTKGSCEADTAKREKLAEHCHFEIKTTESMV